MIALAALALTTVLTGFTQPPQPDEGTGAHIFQLAIVLLLAVGVLFLATADRSRSWRDSARPVLIALPIVAFAFFALYWLEHWR